MAIVTVGIDLAKNVFAVQGVDEAGKPALVRPEVPRAKLLELIANLPPCLIGMEACSGAHHWSREFSRYGHTVRMMAPKFVVPYRMSGKRARTMPLMRLRSVKPSPAPTCDLCRSKASSNFSFPLPCSNAKRSKSPMPQANDV